MKKIHCYTLALSILGSAAAFAATIETGRNTEDQDIRALKEWIDTKRQVSLKEIGGDLSISGEVRTEYQRAHEVRNGVQQRGQSHTAPLPVNTYDIEVNLMFDFRTDRTWASVKLEFDNDAGIFSGSLGKISLERAYWAARLISCDSYTFDVEVGRRFMTSIFDSKVEFGSFFDGILFRFNRSFEKIADVYLHLGAFLIFDKKIQYGYAAEVGMLNYGGTGIYTKFSVVDWQTREYHPDYLRHRFDFIVTEAILGYRFKLPYRNRLGILYSAFLYNWAAERLPVTGDRLANWGTYFGFSLGQLLKQWDFALDANYQIVAAQCIPDFDVSGIGLGNANKSGFYAPEIKPLILPPDKQIPNTRKTAGGQTNYHGFSITFDLLLTDKLDWQNSYVQSWTLNEHIGPRRRYNQYEMEFIYSW